MKAGDIKIGKNYQKSVAHACIDCHKIRWVQMRNGKPKSLRCFPCSVKVNTGMFQKGDNVKHGGWRTRIYRIWRDMKSRCYSPCFVNNSYQRKGITVCDDWKNDFVAFRDFALAHGYQDNLSIDRIDNDGNYEDGNVQFIPLTDNRLKDYQYRPVKQYSLDGELLGYFYSINQAQKVTGAKPQNIIGVCSGKVKTAGGYKWVYAQEKKWIKQNECCGMLQVN
jgi:hypothetical protein